MIYQIKGALHKVQRLQGFNMNGLIMLDPLVLSNRLRFMLRSSDLLSRLTNQLLCVLIVDLIPSRLLIAFVPVLELILKSYDELHD